MQNIYLTDAVLVRKVSETDTVGHFEIDGLYTGYGLTVGAAIRRVLLSSLPGAAITRVKIRGISHEFSTIPGVLEDMVEIMLNFKKVRFRVQDWEPQVLTLKIKGEREVKAKDIKDSTFARVITPEMHLATLTDKSAELDAEITVEKGLGYVPVEARKTEKLPIGVVELDAVFSPVIRVNFSSENMRVGDRTDYNRLKLMIETDGSITPSSALRKAGRILADHFGKVGEIEVSEPAEAQTDGEKAAEGKSGGDGDGKPAKKKRTAAKTKEKAKEEEQKGA